MITLKRCHKLLTQIMDLKDVDIKEGYYGPWDVRMGVGYKDMLKDYYPVASNGRSTTQVRKRVLMLDGIRKVIVDKKLAESAVQLDRLASIVVDIVPGGMMEGEMPPTVITVTEVKR